MHWVLCFVFMVCLGWLEHLFILEKKEEMKSKLVLYILLAFLVFSCKSEEQKKEETTPLHTRGETTSQYDDTSANIEGAKIVDKPLDTEEIHTSVDVEADYGDGGLNGFRTKVMENFDSEAVQGEGVLTTTVTFVVESNGTVSQVKATGSNPDFNREAERVVRSIKEGWKPAKKDGANVGSYYSLPLKMKFE